MSFALRAGEASNIAIFGIAVLITGVLVVLEKAALWMLYRNVGGTLPDRVDS